MGISEIGIMMLVYGGLWFYSLHLAPSKNKRIAYVKSSVFLMVVYGFISANIWFTYKGEEDHINAHSGLEPISFTEEAILLIAGFSLYCAILLFFSRIIKRRSVKIQS